MNQFNNINEVIAYFSNEDRCRTMLEQQRWPDGKIVCPKCGQRGAYRNSDMKTYKCKSKTCMNKFSITVGTMFEGSKLPLSKWFTAMYLVTAHKKGVSSLQLSRNLGIGQKAAWFMIHRIREMLKDKNAEQLSNTVEIDEAYIGGKWANMSKKKRAIMAEGGKDNKTAVMGMVERQGNAKLTVIGKRNFKEVVRQHVSTNAFINTDEHLGYWGLNLEFADHDSVKHSSGEYRKNDVYTNTVEGFFSHFKRMLQGTYHNISPKHLQSYCDEHAYRYNTRKIKDIDRFALTFTKIEGRLTYNTLINRNNK